MTAPYSFLTDPKRLGRRGGQAHLVRLAQRLTVSPSNLLEFWLWSNVLEKALTKNVVKLVAVRVDRGDWNGYSPGFGRDSLNGAVERSLKRGLSDTEIRPRQIRQDKAHVVHVGDGDEEVRKRGGRHYTKVGTPDGNGNRILQVGRKFVEKENEWITAEQLFPRFGTGCAKQRGDIAGELLGFAELLSDRPPDPARGIRTSSVEAGYATAP